MAQNAINRYAVVIGGSAGSLDVLLKLFTYLSADTGAVFIVVIHRKNDTDSILMELLGYRTKMKVSEVEDKDPVLSNHIYVAPADYHLLLENEQNFSLDSSEKIHFSRPSIDVTMETVASVYGKNTIGVLLSGANADGVTGLKRIREAGGFAIVQDPKSADVSYMPEQAVAAKVYDAIVPADEIAAMINMKLKT
jgi:two-component system, chemotaxis family, protein-glutamate methylesterase/glutaminase